MKDKSQSPRRENRKSVNVPIEFRFSDKEFMGVTENLSLGGMFVTTKVPLPISQKTFFKMRSFGKPLNFHLEGEVVWNNGKGCGFNRRDLPKGMGIRFLDSRVLKRDAIEDFVKFIEESSFRLCV